MLKAKIPAAVCLLVLIYCCWALVQSNRKSVLEDPKTTVEITVHGPDGSIIPAVGPIHPAPQPQSK